jgi:hypothetical protein
MADGLLLDPEALRAQVRDKYREVAVDTFGGAKGEENARAFEVYGYAFMASRAP